MTALKLSALGLIAWRAPLAWLPAIAREIAWLFRAGDRTLLGPYVVAIALSYAGLVVLPFIRSGWLRVPLAIVLVLGFAFDQAFLNISGSYMTLDMTATLWRERAMAGGAWSSYERPIVQSAVVGLMVLTALVLRPRGRFNVGARWATAPLGALLLSAGILHGTSGLIDAFPSPYSVPAQFAVATMPVGKSTFHRLPVEYEGPLRPMARKIVMVVDESVRGDKLQLNDAAYDNTPFLAANRERIANYGTAVSAANCSVAARLILRTGLRQDQLPDTGRLSRRLPSLWDYAKNAGLTTALVDVWRPVGVTHSYMGPDETAKIDIWKGPPGGRDYSDMTDAHLRDVAAADTVVELLGSEEPMLIYVNKWGIHPPYASVVPPDLQYTPAIGEDKEQLSPEHRSAVLDFHRALRWSVDGFFARVLPALEGGDAVLVYTSDHGQALYEGGYELSHCSVSPDLHRGEVFVPLFVGASSPDLLASFERAAEGRVDRATHFEVYPTLLELMGYSPAWVEQRYGPSLLTFNPAHPRRFLLGTVFSPAAMLVDVD